MSNFKKLFYTLIFILIIEIILILVSHHKQEKFKTIPTDKTNIAILIDINSNNIDIYKNKKIIKSYNKKPSAPPLISNLKIINKGNYSSGLQIDL
ncbi:hypothetical protein ACFLKB_00525 [Clostridium sp. FAM 1755]|uniref:hypothetical protein n=1 Tax=Clostridium TaxID=1485 RepID=UPI0006AB812F|nr:hypothetical protein [Clostridium sp. L74]KOR24362.1 hypothetical protein ND00_27490 [Clostridium sp. L74]